MEIFGRIIANIGYWFMSMGSFACFLYALIGMMETVGDRDAGRFIVHLYLLCSSVLTFAYIGEHWYVVNRNKGYNELGQGDAGE